MSYDQTAVAAGVLVSTVIIIYKYIVLRTYHFVRCFKVVRVAFIESLQKEIRELENANRILRQGIVVSQDDVTGQISFDLPTEEVLTKRFPYPYFNKKTGELEQWEQVWNIKDWINCAAGLKYVKRRRQYLWVDEMESGDVEASYPFTMEYVGSGKVTKRRRYARQFKKVAIL